MDAEVPIIGREILAGIVENPGYSLNSAIPNICPRIESYVYKSEKYKDPEGRYGAIRREYPNLRVTLYLVMFDLPETIQCSS